MDELFQWFALLCYTLHNDPTHGPLSRPSALFLRDLMFPFKLHLSAEEDVRTTSEAIANVTKAIFDLFVLAVTKDVRGEDLILVYNQFVGSASMSEHFKSKDLADVTVSLLSCLQCYRVELSEMLEREILKNMLFLFDSGPTISYDVTEREYHIQSWVRLNSLAAYLAKAKVLPFREFAPHILDLAFRDLESPDTLDVEDYHVPAVGAWLSIMGREIRSLAVTNDDDDPYFSRPKWDDWKEILSDAQFWLGTSLDFNQAAEEAWYDMDALEEQIPTAAQAIIH